MATESVRLLRFRDALRQAAGPKAVYFKFNDKSTAGTPDSTFTFNGRTLWLEAKMKYADDDRPLGQMLRSTNRRAKAQIYNIWSLGIASQGRAFFLIFGAKGGISLVRVTDPYREIFEVFVTDSQAKIVNTLLSLCQ